MADSRFLGVYSKFFGAKGTGPQRQTTLAFSSKAGKKAQKKEDDKASEDEDVDVKDDSDAQQG